MRVCYLSHFGYCRLGCPWPGAGGGSRERWLEIIEMYSLTLVEVTNLKSKSWWEWIPLESSKETLFHDSALSNSPGPCQFLQNHHTGSRSSPNCKMILSHDHWFGLICIGSISKQGHMLWSLVDMDLGREYFSPLQRARTDLKTGVTEVHTWLLYSCLDAWQTKNIESEPGA